MSEKAEKGSIAGAVAEWRVLDAAGKSAGRADTYHGHFSRLVPDEQVVKVFDGDTDVVVVHEGIPDSVPATDDGPFQPPLATHVLWA